MIYTIYGTPDACGCQGVSQVLVAQRRGLAGGARARSIRHGLPRADGPHPAQPSHQPGLAGPWRCVATLHPVPLTRVQTSDGRVFDWPCACAWALLLAAGGLGDQTQTWQGVHGDCVADACVEPPEPVVWSVRNIRSRPPPRHESFMRAAEHPRINEQFAAEFRRGAWQATPGGLACRAKLGIERSSGLSRHHHHRGAQLPSA